MYINENSKRSISTKLRRFLKSHRACLKRNERWFLGARIMRLVSGNYVSGIETSLARSILLPSVDSARIYRRTPFSSLPLRGTITNVNNYRLIDSHVHPEDSFCLSDVGTYFFFVKVAPKWNVSIVTKHGIHTRDCSDSYRPVVETAICFVIASGNDTARLLTFGSSFDLTTV